MPGSSHHHHLALRQLEAERGEGGLAWINSKLCVTVTVDTGGHMDKMRVFRYLPRTFKHRNSKYVCGLIHESVNAY